MSRVPQDGSLRELRHIFFLRQVHPFNSFIVDTHMCREQIQSQALIDAHIPFPRNAPRQGRSEYPRHNARQGELTHPMNGAGHGGPFLGIPGSPRLQSGVGHGVSVNQCHPSRRPMPPSPHPVLNQPYPVARPANVPYARPPSDIPPVQGVFGGPYYQQGYFNLLFLAAVTNR
jgi:hypothetical protein